MKFRIFKSKNEVFVKKIRIFRLKNEVFVKKIRIFGSKTGFGAGKMGIVAAPIFWPDLPN